MPVATGATDRDRTAATHADERAAVALDWLRRELAREQRMLTATSGPYSSAEDRLAVYAQRTEEHIARYDEQMVEYHSQVVRDAR